MKESRKIFENIYKEFEKLEEIGILKKASHAMKKAFKNKSIEEGNGIFYLKEEGHYVLGDNHRSKQRKINKIFVGTSESEGHKFAMNYDWKNGNMSWLNKAQFEAKTIVVDDKSGELKYFNGNWESGDFRDATFSGSLFNGGKFINGFLNILYSNWKEFPVNFIGNRGGSSKGGILGLPNATGGKGGFHLIQVPPGFSIVIKQKGKRVIQTVNVIKRTDNSSSDFIYENNETKKTTTVPWEKIRKSYDSFELKKGTVLDIKGVFEGQVENIQVVSTSSIKPEDAVSRANKKNTNPVRRFNVKAKTPVFKDMGIQGEYKFWAKDVNDLLFFNQLMDDLESGGNKITKAFTDIKNNRSGFGKNAGLKNVLPNVSQLADQDSLNFVDNLINRVIDNLGTYDPKKKTFTKDKALKDFMVQTIRNHFAGIKGGPKVKSTNPKVKVKEPSKSPSAKTTPKQTSSDIKKSIQKKVNKFKSM